MNAGAEAPSSSAAAPEEQTPRGADPRGADPRGADPSSVLQQLRHRRRHVYATGADPRAARGADPGAARGADPGAARGADPGAARGADPGAARGADPGAARGADPGAARGADPRSSQRRLVVKLPAAAAAVPSTCQQRRAQSRSPSLRKQLLSLLPQLVQSTSCVSLHI